MFNTEIIKSLNDLELVLYRYIIKNIEKVIYMRIRELAEEAHVSTTTILRFCKKFGCNGYSEFKVKLKIHLETLNNKKINNDQTMIIDFFKKLNTDELNEKLETICDLIYDFPNVLLVGSGTSGIMCKYAARFFSTMGKFATYIDDPYFPTNYGTYENCVIIALSVSGETSPGITLINNFKKENCPIISITNSENCTISKISDLNISYYITQEKVGMSDITTQVPVLYIIETIGRLLHNRINSEHN